MAWGERTDRDIAVHFFTGKATRPAALCGGLLLVHAILLAWAAVSNSATYDEPAHLGAGVAYWKQGDFSIYSLSPPLLRLWGAAPAVLAGAQSPDTQSVHQYEVAARHVLYTDQFIYANEDRFNELLTLARFAMIPLSCLTGWLTYRWATQLYGGASGLAACALFCFNPSMLAHGGLMNTDMGTTAMIIATAWLWWRFCNSPRFLRWIGVCLALLIVNLCKFTAVLLWPMMLLMAVPAVIANRPIWRKLLLAWIGALLMTIFLLNAVYGFRGTGRTIGSYQFASDMMKKVQTILPANTPVPMPTLLVEGFDAQKRDEDPGYQAFLFGENYIGARWYYYPAALLCKLPICAMLLLAAATVSLLYSRPGAAGKDVAGEWSLALAALAYLLGVLVAGSMNIGTRYLFPLFPLTMIFTSRLWTYGQPRSRFSYIRNGLLAAMVIETLLAAPQFISFINIGASQYAADLADGGPSGGWRLINDSDFDWGQDLKRLKSWMQDNNVNSIALGYFGYIDPKVYGINYSPLFNPDKDEKYAAISSFYLDGMYNRMIASPYTRAWVRLPGAKILRQKTPIAVVGTTILIYPLDQVQAAELIGSATGQ
jgi:hypothetical protein